MRKTNFLSRWILISGIIISLIGLIHIAMTPGMSQHMGNSNELKKYVPGFIYFFVLAGASFFFCGVLTIYSSIGLRKTERWSFVVALTSGIFIVLAQTSAIVFAKFGNPLIYLCGVCSISNIIILLIFRTLQKFY